MANGRIQKDMLYGELVTGARTIDRPYLRYRETCERDMKLAGIDTTTWEAAADDRGHWRAVVKAGMRRGEENRSVYEAVKREKRKQKSSHPAHPPHPTIYICHKCGRDCHARVGLIRHSPFFFFFFLTKVDKIRCTKPLSSETEGCLVVDLPSINYSYFCD